MYTSRIDPDAAHYVMSVTKSVLSATVGAAIARGLIQTTDVSLAEALPLSLFGTKANQDRFRTITLTHAMGMSALDALLPPHGVSNEDVKRGQDFWDAKNRVAFGLTQNLLPTPGSTFQYQDITPVLAAGCVQYAAKQSLFDFAKDSLFEPMQFANAEWMHQDASGTDMAGYGLRLRPVDMQKFGVLYLRKGAIGARQLLPTGWVDWSFRPWMKSHPSYARANYGAYFWTYEYAEGWTTRMANGWRGQRIAIVPEQELVVTMTADIVSQDEEAVFQDIMMSWVKPAVERGTGKTQQSPESALALAKALADVTNGPSRINPTGEPRMVPSVHNKETRIAFVP